jgi:hypothetical protein
MKVLLRVCQSRFVIAEVEGQFWNPEEEERPPLEVVTRGLVKRQLNEKT